MLEIGNGRGWFGVSDGRAALTLMASSTLARLGVLHFTGVYSKASS